jgi:hypothetical protein
MLPRFRLALAALLGVALVAGSLRADLTDSLKKGDPDFKSIGALAFAPDGVLFFGDSLGGAIFAVATADTPKEAATGELKMEDLSGKLGQMLGIEGTKIKVNGVAVNPASGKAYLSVARGTATDAPCVLMRVDRAGKIEEVQLKDVKFGKAALPNPPKAESKQRLEAITSLAYVKGKVIVAGLSNEDFASKLRVIPFPFSETDKGASVQIFHSTHGKLETDSPVRTFVPYEIKGEDNLLAAYTCTPLVKFPVSDLKPGEKVKGTTIAELGNYNKPLDMITYTKDGKDYLLIANSNRGVMKVPTEGIEKLEPITKSVKGVPTGIKYDTLKELKGVEHLVKLDKEHALLLVKSKEGTLSLETIALP